MKHFIFFVFMSLFVLEFTPNLAIADTSSEQSQSEVEFQKAVSALKAGDRDLSVSIFTELAEQDHVESQYELATIFFNERGGPKGKGKEAYHWYRLAAEKGHAKAQHKLGLIASVGMFGLKSTEVAIKWYDKAAKQGLVEAQHDLGLFYVKYFTRNYVHSYAWLLNAASNGHATAGRKLKVLSNHMAPHQISEAEKLADMLLRPDSITSKPASLLRWDFKSGIDAYKKEDMNTAFAIIYPLALDGYQEAQYQIALMYEKGEDAPHDEQIAFQWYEKAALRGFPQAQSALGLRYAIGNGVKQDFVQAYTWLSIANAYQDVEASELIEIIDFQLDSSQIKQVEEDVSDWVTNHPKFTPNLNRKGAPRPQF
ncbi:tetratricopeptide repeat protein [Kiloniella antarctica]|uniref:Tetratricopeptide repeat protein n=1 Tax=Kiloniella antarctica TaxID=1550907 RepID=A0ABW5BLB1_9PROT